MVLLPGPLQAGNAQVGDGKAAQARLGLGSASGGALIANLTARTRGRAGVRGYGRGMIVGLHLHQDMDILVVLAIDPILRRGHEAPALPTLNDGGIVPVGREYLVRRLLGGMPDHAEEGMPLGLTVDDPVGVEDLVPAMF